MTTTTLDDGITLDEAWLIVTSAVRNLSSQVRQLVSRLFLRSGCQWALFWAAR